LQILLLHLRRSPPIQLRARQSVDIISARRARNPFPAFYLCNARRPAQGPAELTFTRLAQADGKNCSRANFQPCVWRLLIGLNDYFFTLGPINVGYIEHLATLQFFQLVGLHERSHTH
jgi:hypothetical protein